MNRLHTLFFCLGLTLAILFFALAFGGKRDAYSQDNKNQLVIATRLGATSYFYDESQQQNAIGFEHDLVQMFAQKLGKTVQFVLAKSDLEIQEKLKKGEVHFAAAWLTPEIEIPTKPGAASLARSSSPYFASKNVFVTHEASLPLGSFEQLAGRTVHVIAKSQQAEALRKIQTQWPTVDIVEENNKDELTLLAEVAKKGVTLALVDQAVFSLAVNYYPELQSSLSIEPERPITWLFAPHGDPNLLRQANEFITEIAQDGRLGSLKDRYFGHVERLKQVDIVSLLERMRTVLPRYRNSFKTAQARTGIDWRLLAALAYQESQWNPLATSVTGVRGMMMLTEETADQLGVSNRLDPEESIRAGSNYLASLRDALPAGTQEPDRLWLALAAYNLGMGHLNAARNIAKGVQANADVWYEMKKVLPLLARPNYYRRLKSGKGRGGEAVTMVENIRIYADIIKRHEAP
ncbi:MAG: membrane-bound lytic murein transglycosylase MltF [Pseudomonadota bacterium]